jgi:hypothetical protein
MPPRLARETRPFFGTRSTYRKLIRYRGVAHGATTDEQSLFGLRRKSNVFRIIGRGCKTSG